MMMIVNVDWCWEVHHNHLSNLVEEKNADVYCTFSSFCENDEVEDSQEEELKQIPPPVHYLWRRRMPMFIVRFRPSVRMMRLRIVKRRS